MLKVLVKFVGRPYEMTGKRQTWLYFNNSCDKVTLRDLLNRVEKETGVRFSVGEGGIVILVNGRNVDYVGGLNANLKDLDEVIIASVAGGG